MNEPVLIITLYLTLTLPIFLALAATHLHPSRCIYLAIVPVAILLVIPGEIHVVPPWFMFQAGLSIESNSTRWLLGMAAVVWLTAARLSMPNMPNKDQRHKTVYFMLTMAGNLGVILAADLVAYFFFSTLMSYSFYGLIMQDTNESGVGAGRLYIIFLVVADLLLFEALLIAASVTNNLQFAAIHEIMVDLEVSALFLWVTIIGFVLKAAIWPAHLWLSAILNTAVTPVRVLPGGVPIAMALLGLVRWLPLGETTSAVIGNTLQALGVVAVISAVTMCAIRRERLLTPLWSIMVISGLFMGALGTGVTDPNTWLAYGHLVYPLIAGFGIFSAMIMRSEYRHGRMTVDTVDSWVTMWTNTCRNLCNPSVARMMVLSADVKAAGRLYVERLGMLGASLDLAERFLRGWQLAVTLVVIVAILIGYFAHAG